MILLLDGHEFQGNIKGKASSLVIGKNGNLTAVMHINQLDQSSFFGL